MSIKTLSILTGRNHITYFPYSSNNEWKTYDNFSHSWNEEQRTTVFYNVEKRYKGFINWFLEDSIVAQFFRLFTAPVI